MSTLHGMDKTRLSVSLLDEPSDDLEYWLSRTPEERLAGIETCRGYSMDTTRLPPDFKDFLRLLTDHQVEYLLIGGYAVGHFGYVRATAGMDIWIAPATLAFRCWHATCASSQHSHEHICCELPTPSRSSASFSRT